MSDAGSTSKAGGAVRTKRIVVGVDGSPAAGEALDWAVNEAALRGATLEVASVWEDPYRYWGEAVPTEAEDEAEVEVRAKVRALAASAAEKARFLRTDIEVRPVSAEGGAADRLIEMSFGAELLVVGTRGRGGFRGLVLGSVSQQCISHAHCPVVVVREIEPHHVTTAK